MQLKSLTKETLLIIALALIIVDRDAQADNVADHCGIGEVTSFAHAGVQGFSQFFSGHPLTGLAESVVRCQARLYDDNGPLVPHVWCERDLFLLGIFMFENYMDFDFHRESSIDFLQQFVNTLDWTSNAGTFDVELARSPFRDALGAGVGHVVLFHDYAVMGGNTLPPGEYSWEWLSTHPLAVEPGNPDGIIVIIAGDVHIVPHAEHLARVAAGTW